MNLAHKPLEADLYKLIVGDLRGMNPYSAIVQEPQNREHTLIEYIASDRTFGEVTEAISAATFEREFSLDLRCVSDTVAVIRVRLYAPIKIEGLT